MIEIDRLQLPLDLPDRAQRADHHPCRLVVAEANSARGLVAVMLVVDDQRQQIALYAG
jgi:hypothetical protein